MRLSRYLIHYVMFFLLLIVLTGCTDRSIILYNFISDEKMRNAANFLLDQSEDRYAVSLRYKNNNSDNLNSQINNYLEEGDIVDSLNAYSVNDTVWDKDGLDMRYLVKNVRLAFEQYRNNPLKMTVPDSIFYEYVLPYRVGNEELYDWRSHFSELYTNYLITFNKNMFDEKFIIDMVHRFQKISYHVYDRTGLAKYPISRTQSLKEIREVGYPYDCDDYAIFKLYSLRSIGLPAAFETIPLYGKFNFGHSETALWHRDGKFHCTEGKTQMPYKFQIAKMYRKRFSPKESPYQQIISLGEKPRDIPDYFDMPYYEDITHERTPVSDININPIKDFENEKIDNSRIAYLCVYNNGEWKPVEWAKKNKRNSWIFKNMGRQIIYQLATSQDGNMNLIGRPILLDSLGNIMHFENVKNTNASYAINLKNYDRSDKLYKGNFELLFWDSEQKKWKSNKKFKSENDSTLILLSENTLYKIQPDNSNKNPRPFTIKNNEQIWW